MEEFLARKQDRVATNLENMENLENSANLQSCQNFRETQGNSLLLWRKLGKCETCDVILNENVFQ